MEKGILSEALESKAGIALDDLIKLNGFLEAVDGLFFTTLIKVLDNNLAEKIPEPYKSEIAKLLVEIFEEEDYATACDLAFDFVNVMVDIPGLDDPTEELVFNGIASVIAGLLAKLNTNEGN